LFYERARELILCPKLIVDTTSILTWHANIWIVDTTSALARHANIWIVDTMAILAQHGANGIVDTTSTLARHANIWIVDTMAILSQHGTDGIVDAMTLLAHHCSSGIVDAMTLLAHHCSSGIVDAMTLLAYHTRDHNWLRTTSMTFQVHCMHLVSSSIFEPKLTTSSSIVTQDDCTTAIKGRLNSTSWACHPLRLSIRLLFVGNVNRCIGFGMQ